MTLQGKKYGYAVFSKHGAFKIYIIIFYKLSLECIVLTNLSLICV